MQHSMMSQMMSGNQNHAFTMHAGNQMNGGIIQPMNNMPMTADHQMTIPGPPPIDQNTLGGDANHIADDSNNGHIARNATTEMILNSEDLPESDKEEDDHEFDGLYDNPGSNTKLSTAGDRKIGAPGHMQQVHSHDEDELEYGDEEKAHGTADGVEYDDEYEYYEEYYEENGDDVQYEEVAQNGSPHSVVDEVQFYSYEDLQSGDVLQGVENKEQYLSDVEFEEVFSMTKEKFNSLRPWKQKSLRSAKGLSAK